MSVITLVTGCLVDAPQQRQTADGRAIVKATVKARLGKDQNEIWTILAHDRKVQADLMRLGAGQFLSLQGVHQIRTAVIHGQTVLQRTLFPSVAISLKPGEVVADAPLS
jgi:hypothetical protein